MHLSLTLIGFLIPTIGQWSVSQEEAYKSYRAIPITQKLGTPIETVRTLCFAADCFKLKPEIISEAVQCLETDKDSLTTHSINLLAMELQEILDELSPQLTGLNVQPDQNQVTLYEDNGVKMALHRGTDGLWRFDRETVSKIPLLRKVSAEKERTYKKKAELLRLGMEYPTETMTHFMTKAIRGDFQTAASHLDLTEIPQDKRGSIGPYLAWKLAATIQRKGYIFPQLVPSDPDGPRYNWTADASGKISVNKVYQLGSQDLWQFDKETIRNIPALFENAKKAPIDLRYKILGQIVPEVPEPDNPFTDQKNSMPVDIPLELSSPRTMLQSFFIASILADLDVRNIQKVNQYLDLTYIPLEDRELLGPKRAEMLEAVLRKISPDIDSITDHWSAPHQTIHEGNFTILIVRQKDGCWRFSPDTVARAPEMFHKLAPEDQGKTMQMNKYNNPRNAMFTFLAHINQFRNEDATRVLDLSELPVAARQEMGPILAFKMKFIIDRLGHFFLQEIPIDEKLTMFEFYRGELGTLIMEPIPDDKGIITWKFNTATVRQIEYIFEKVMDLPPRKIFDMLKSIRLKPDPFVETGLWLRLRYHFPTMNRFLGITYYQWMVLGITIIISFLTASLAKFMLGRTLKWLLANSSLPDLDKRLRRNLRAAWFLTIVLVFYLLFPLVDLPYKLAGPVFVIEKILLTLAITWFGVQTVDKFTIFYEASRRMDKYRGITNILVPFCNKVAKVLVVLIAITYLVRNFGESESLGRFLAGLGIVGLGISLAAQDSLKNLFGTLLLISDRTFRVGDRLLIGDKEGIVEEVGFRSTKLRTPEDSILILPNATLANGIIDNFGLRKLRRIRLMFGLDLHTPVEKIQELQDKLRAFMAGMPPVEPDRIGVVFLKVGELGLEFEITAYGHFQDNESERALKESILEATLRLCRDLDIKPTNLKK